MKLATRRRAAKFVAAIGDQKVTVILPKRRGRKGILLRFPTSPDGGDVVVRLSRSFAEGILRKAPEGFLRDLRKRNWGMS